MSDVQLLLALTAGVLAAVNPCGFALLPAYLSLLMADGQDDAGPGGAVGRAGTLLRALSCTAATTLGFVLVFGAFGLVLTPVAGWLQQRLPWFTIGFGLLLAGLGCWLSAGRQLPVLGHGPSRAPQLRRTLPSMVLFGAAYALASLSCTIGPFLAIVVSSLRAGSTLAGVALFVAYAAGMGLVVGVAAVAVALLRTSVLRRLRRGGAALGRAGGLLLIVTGGYVAYYGWYEVRLARQGPAALGDPVIAIGDRVQRWLAGGLDRAGVAAVAGAFACLLVLALLAGWLRRRGAARPGRTTG